MHYVAVEPYNQEQVYFIDENTKSTQYNWVNLTQAHEIKIIEVGFNFYVAAVFSPDEMYYIKSFDCEKAARHYAKDLINN